MTRRIILILIGAIIVLALMFALWFWLFGKQAEVQENLGGFGSGEDRQPGTGTGAGGGNEQTPIGGTTEIESLSNIQTPLYVSPTFESPNLDGLGGVQSVGSITLPGVSWLDGTGGGAGGGSAAFNPTPINQINNVTIDGTAYFTSAPDGGGGVGLGGALLGVAGGCIANYLAQKATAAGSSFATGIFASIVAGQVRTTDIETHAGLTADALIQCVVRALARIAIQQITAQTVNWINSGFDGQPAFVQNFDQFFTDVADKAAGDVIQGSGLSFLCSPFQLQVRIAIAKSYARRSSGAAAAQACTLTDVVGNVDGFIRGNFSEGGWPGLIAFTTVPGNNPFGAYAGAQVLLNNRIIHDTVNAERMISPGGFLSQQECDINPTTGFETCKVVTPGSTVQASLEATLKTNLDSLQLASSIDEIINALINSFTTNILQKGLANVTGRDVGGLSTADQQATAEAETLLQSLRAAVQRAQQYGSIQQGSIGDIQTAQASLTTLENCWLSKSEPSDASDAAAQRAALEVRVTQFNANIVRANAAITQVEQLQTQALSASNVTQVRAVATALAQAESSGALITAADVTLAQQNRTTLQAEMAAINQQTSLELNQCYAS